MTPIDDALRIVFIGAGGVNFGGAEGPWDHASRLERIGDLRVVGVADPDTARAESVLAERRAGAKADLYADAEAFADFREMLDAVGPHAAFIGVPPDAHGGARPPRDVEVACADAGVHLFIEKPLSALPPEDMAAVTGRLAEARNDGLIVSVGYMFRYSRAVDRMRELIAEAGGPVRAVLARYDCAYSRIAKAAWWDVRRSGGPIVEQATHFCDLARVLAGEADPESVRALAITASGPAGQLSDVPAANGGTVEDAVPAERRAPRATTAIWRFADGGLGSLAHGVLLHGRKYAAELEVWCDGLRLVLQDPYDQCRLLIRRPGEERTTVEEFAEDDPYLNEDAAFCRAVRTGDESHIRCTYDDAMRTHRLTWAIRRAGE